MVRAWKRREMRLLTFRLIALTLAITVNVSFAQSPGLGVSKSVVPKDGFVPTAVVAIAVAEAVLVPVYGAEQIASERPFKAALSNGVWQVTGSVKCDGPPGSICPGGAAEVKISKKTGQILFMTHYQ